MGGAVPLGHAHGSVQHRVDRAGRDVRQEFLRQDRDTGTGMGERAVTVAATQQRQRHATSRGDLFRQLVEHGRRRAVELPAAMEATTTLALAAADIALAGQHGPGERQVEITIRGRRPQDLQGEVRVGGNDARLALLQPREVAGVVLSWEVHDRKLIDNLPFVN